MDPDLRVYSAMLEFTTCGSCARPEQQDGTALSKCGRCKVQHPCSVECQKQHWDKHKLVCKDLAKYYAKHPEYPTPTPLPRNDSAAGGGAAFAGPGVMIEPVRMAQAQGGYAYALWPATNKETVTKALQFPTSELAVSQAVGFPVRLIGTSHGDTSAPNTEAKVLGLNPDPDSPHFGESRWVPAPTGTALVTRRDLKDLHINQVTALTRFCDAIFKDAAELAKKAAKGEKVDKHAFAAERINPKAFAKFFNEMKESEMAKDPKGWQGVECPVEGI